jgi:hypothetical protein
MTEAAFQECRKVMQKANYLRGLITEYKMSVFKWTRFESGYREKLKHDQADGARKCLDKAMKRLEQVRKQFADLKFPDPEIKNKTHEA